MTLHIIRPLVILVATLGGWLGYELAPEHIETATLVIGNLIAAIVAAWAFADNLRKDHKARKAAEDADQEGV